MKKESLTGIGVSLKEDLERLPHPFHHVGTQQEGAIMIYQTVNLLDPMPPSWIPSSTMTLNP
jgi:hypothetical protein